MSDDQPEYPVFGSPASPKPPGEGDPGKAHISHRPLWLIGLMFAFHIAWMAFCALWIPITFGAAISQRFGSPVFILPAIILVYALAPFVASFSELGREYWDMLGRGGTARRATIKLLIFGALSLVLAPVIHHVLITF